MHKGGTMRIRKSNPIEGKLKLEHNNDNQSPRHRQDIGLVKMVNHLKDNNLGYWEHWWKL